jgi:hypothetical protein
MSTVVEYINQIIQAADEASVIDAQLDDRYGIDNSLGIDPSAPCIVDRLNAKNGGDEKLKSILRAMSLGDLERIHALMYAGREREPVSYMRDYFRKEGKTRIDMERAVLEKSTALRTYFDNACAKAATDGVDINTF